MAKPATKDRPSHRCSECGLTVGKWIGRCPQCQAWGSISEASPPPGGGLVAPGAVSAPARRIAEIDVEAARARPSGVGELDRVLGGGLVPGAVVLLAGEPGVGKALALDTPIPTPLGWTTMGEIRVGDKLLGADGRPTVVLAVTDPLHGRPCYEVEFSDGSMLVADAMHEWRTTTRGDRLRARPPSVHTTQDLAQTVRVGTDRRSNHAVRVAQPLQLREEDLLVPPYTFGAWLGAGSSRAAAITSADPEMLLEIEQEGVVVTPLPADRRFGLRLVPPEVVLAQRSCLGCHSTFSLRSERSRFCSNACKARMRGRTTPWPAPVCSACGNAVTGFEGDRGRCRACMNALSLSGRLHQLGVWGDKHIPAVYLRASEDQRRALLAGLLDTEGYVTPAGCVQLALTSRQLARGAYELIASLGYKASRTVKRAQGRSMDSSTCFVTSFATGGDKVFRLSRNVARLRGGTRPAQALRYVTGVRRVDSVPVRCVQVDTAERLFLAGESFIPTHNSTLLMSVSSHFAKEDAPTLYVTGEESAAQVRLRAGRMDALDPHLWLAAETDLAAVLAHVDAVRPGLLVVDSVQTIASAQVEGGAGGVTQIRAVTAALIAVAKERAIATVLVGHVTKDGGIAGPRLLEHLVDVVLQFEGERHSTLRMVRAVKNRFGPADEVGCFVLGDTGIEGLPDPSGLFLTRRTEPVPGTCVTVTVEGRRPMPAEVQALVDKSQLNNPRRAVSGLDSGRVGMVLAVLSSRGGVRLGDSDVYVATVGGVRLSEPAADLAVALAVTSACTGRALPPDLVAIGEVGLSGEVRPVTSVSRRLVEAGRLGFTRALVPVDAGIATPPRGMRVTEVADVGMAIAAVNTLRPLPRGPRPA